MAPRQLFKPFPGYKPKRRSGEVVGAQFYVGNLGHVIRGHDIGKSIESEYLVKVYDRGKTLNVRLGGGGQTLSLPNAVAAAFATVACPVESDQRVWVPIIAPGTPVDPLTGQTRCAATDLYWVSYSESCKWSRAKHVEPTTMIAIV